MNSADTSTKPPRSPLVTVLAWAAIVLGALGSVISFFSLLMLIVGSYGTKTGGVLAWLITLAGPPLTFLAGIGLLRRRRWAWFCIVGILFAALAWQASEIAFPPPTEDRTFIDPNGVPTTIMGSGSSHSTPIIVLTIAALAVLFSAKSRAEFAAAPTVVPAVPSNSPAPPASPRAPSRSELDAAEERDIARGWRVGHRGRDQMFYEERRDGVWQCIAVDGEMLTGRAHHVIYFASAEMWQRYPEWARLRRDEIIARIKSEFREPDYEYADGGTVPTAAPPPAKPTGPVKGLRVLIAVAIALLAIAGGLGWFVQDSIARGVTKLPAKHTARLIARESDPALFWTSIGIYSAVALGCAALAAWGLSEARKLAK